MVEFAASFAAGGIRCAQVPCRHAHPPRARHVATRRSRLLLPPLARHRLFTAAGSFVTVVLCFRITRARAARPARLRAATKCHGAPE